MKQAIVYTQKIKITGSLRRRPNSKRRRIGSAYNGAISCSRDFNLFRRLGTRQRVSCIISASFCEREEK